MTTADRQEEQAYLSKMATVLVRSRPGVPSNNGPAKLLDHLYLGNKRDAKNIPLLKRLKVTAVVNCAAHKDYSRQLVDNPYDESSGVEGYLEFEADDNEGYPIMRHYRAARLFIDRAMRLKGRVLVHCEMGVNRSAALCVAYLMEHRDLTLIQAIREVKIDRPVILTNTGFRKQLYQFADERRLLYPDK